MCRRYAFVLLIVTAAAIPARSARSAGAVPWDLKALSGVPKTYAAEGFPRDLARRVTIGLDKSYGCDMIMGRVARRGLLFDNTERSACAGKQMLSAQVTPLFIPKRTSLQSLPR